MYGIGPTQCLLHCQVLNYDPRLAPSHPDPPVPEYRSLEFLRKTCMKPSAIKKITSRWFGQWTYCSAKSRKNWPAKTFDYPTVFVGSSMYCLLFKPKTHTALKVGPSFCPGVFNQLAD